MSTVNVPDLDHPTLCFKQNLAPPRAMARCTYQKQHEGEHSWAQAESIEDVLKCLKCGAMNKRGASLTVEVEKGRATCNQCGNVWRWPATKGSQ